MRIEIFHNETPREADHLSADNGTACGRFWGFCTNCWLLKVQQFDTNQFPRSEAWDQRLLNELFRAMQNEMADAPNEFMQRVQPERTRSLSVGDVVVLDEDAAFVVAGVGFEPVDPADVRRAVENYLPAA